MWIYEKRLQYPVRITKTCPKTAQLIISQYGGPDGELSASMRYLSQRYTMPVKSVGGLLTQRKQDLMPTILTTLQESGLRLHPRCRLRRRSSSLRGTLSLT